MRSSGEQGPEEQASERNQSPAHDSAGVPFGGREITSTGFDDDDGRADEQLLALIHNADEEEWMRALAASRLLVPIVAAPSEFGEQNGLQVEKETDMAVVTLTSPDGVQALPVFTGMEQLARWNPDARPSPVTACLAAQAAISEGCSVMLLDLSSEHHVVLRTSMLWALAQQHAWVSAHRDPVVRRAVERAVSHHDLVHEYALEDAQEGVLRIRLALAAGLEQEDLQQVATQVGQDLATDGEMRARIDGLVFAFEQA